MRFSRPARSVRCTAWRRTLQKKRLQWRVLLAGAIFAGVLLCGGVILGGLALQGAVEAPDQATQEASFKSVKPLKALCAGALEGVIWLHTYVAADRRHAYCLGDAPSPEAVHQAARRNGLPIDHTLEVRVLNPEHSHKTTRRLRVPPDASFLKGQGT